jgi:hypothetical protein
MSVRSDDGIAINCPGCGRRFVYQVQKADAVDNITDFIIGLMDDYQAKYIAVCEKYVRGDTIERMQSDALGEILKDISGEPPQGNVE